MLSTRRPSRRQIRARALRSSSYYECTNTFHKVMALNLLISTKETNTKELANLQRVRDGEKVAMAPEEVGLVWRARRVAEVGGARAGHAAVERDHAEQLGAPVRKEQCGRRYRTNAGGRWRCGVGSRGGLGFRARGGHI